MTIFAETNSYCEYILRRGDGFIILDDGTVGLPVKLGELTEMMIFYDRRQAEEYLYHSRFNNTFKVTPVERGRTIKIYD